jgi:hypothetical protein
VEIRVGRPFVEMAGSKGTVQKDAKLGREAAAKSISGRCLLFPDPVVFLPLAQYAARSHFVLEPLMNKGRGTICRDTSNGVYRRNGERVYSSTRGQRIRNEGERRRSSSAVSAVVICLRLREASAV